MINDEVNKNFKISQITSAAKFSTLFFSAIAFFQYYFRQKDLYTIVMSYFGVFLAVMLVLLGIYFVLLYFEKYNQKNSIRLITSAILIAITYIAIMFTGANESNYKFLFLFVIISTCIEYGMNAGLVITAISSALLLGGDLLLARGLVINSYFESDLVLVFAFFIISWAVGYYSYTERQHISYLRNLANIDGLTGLYNHRYFYDLLAQKIDQSKIKKMPLSLLFVDIDNFKFYNDVYGHQKGDDVLKLIAAIMQKCVPDNSVVARYGGEEFSILLPNTSEDQAIITAEKLRNAVQEHSFEGQKILPDGNLTISIGVSTYPQKASTDNELIKFADDACYRAKFLRKNRVESYFSVLEELQKDVKEPEREIIASIRTLIAVINAKDKYTYRHVERVVYYCNIIADRLVLDEKQKKDFIYAAYLHDIGKINISEDILMKVDQLTDEEWEVLKKHPQNAVEIIGNIEPLKDAVPIILQHHERFDGTGYPHQLKGDQIAFLARMLTVIDSFDAMTSIRPYQTKKSYAKAIAELKKCSGTQFDPQTVDIFAGTIESIVIAKFS